MALFGFEKDDRRKSKKEDLVEIDATIDGYRHANWDPYVLLQDVRSVGLEASAEGKHLWVTSEAMQMDAASAWLAAVRQSIGHTLVDNNEEKKKLPKDVATMVHANYGSAQSWLKQRETIKTDNDYTLDAPQLLDTSLTWPDPRQQVISPELATSAYRLTGQLITMSLPTILTTLDTSMPYPPEYRGYNEEVMDKLKDIQQQLLHVDMTWNERLDPNVAPGNQVYQDTVQLLESIVRFGVDALVPVAGNRFYKLKPIEKRPENEENAFSPAALRMPRTTAPVTSPAFDISELHRRVTPPTPELKEPAVPPRTPEEAFDPSRFRKSVPRLEVTAPPPTEAEPFNAAKYLQRYLGGHAVHTTASEAFDPTTHARRRKEDSSESSPSGDAGAPEAFDPTNYRRR